MSRFFLSIALASIGLLLINCRNAQESEPFITYDFTQRYFSNTTADTLVHKGTAAYLKPSDSASVSSSKRSMVLPQDSTLYYEYNSNQVTMVYGIKTGIVIDTSHRKEDTYRGNILTHVDITREYFMRDSLFWINANYKKRTSLEPYRGEPHRCITFYDVDTLTNDSLVRKYWFATQGEKRLKRFEHWQEYTGYTSYEEIVYSNYRESSSKDILSEAEKRKNRKGLETTYRDWDAMQTEFTVNYVGLTLDSIPLEVGGFLKVDSIMEDTKYALLDFWYLSCAPCLEAMPKLQQLHSDYINSGDLKILALNPFNYKVAENVKRFMKEKQYTFSSYFVPREWSKDLLIQVYPTTLLLDHTGTVVYQSIGYSDSSIVELRQLIEG